MKQAFITVTILAWAGLTAFADETQSQPVPPPPATDAPQTQDLKKIIEDQGIYVETAKPGINLSGYVDAGYGYGFQGTGTSNANRESQDGKPGSNFSLNAFKLALEKPLSTQNDYSAGFRADLMFGQDAGSIDHNANTGTADGGSTNSSNLFVEQAFVQFNAPTGNGIKFEVGKFVSPLGYEVVERPSNANITYGNLLVNMIPIDNTGVLASYKLNDIIDVKGGVVDGWNTSTGTAIGSTTADGLGLLGTINITAPGGNANLQNGGYIGLNPRANSGAAIATLPDAAAGSTASNHALWVYDIWGQWKPKFAGDKLSLGFEGDLGSYASTSALGVDNSTTWSGAALYAKYQFTKIFSLASRTDWIHSDDSQKFGFVNTSIGKPSEDIYSYTLTAEIDAWENLLLRAEYRLDWGDYVTDIAPAGGPTTSATLGSGPSQLVDLEAVYSF